MSKDFQITESFIAGVKKLFPEDKEMDKLLKQPESIFEVEARLREEKEEILKRDIRTYQIRSAFDGHEKAKAAIMEVLDRLDLIENLLDESHWWGLE